MRRAAVPEDGDRRDLAGEVVDLQAVIGACAARLEEQLHQTSDWAERFRIVERLLTERLAAPAAEHPLVSAALAEIERSQGDLRIGSLAERLDCSRKHLAVTFRRQIGLAPKAFARVLRFGHAVEALRDGGIGSLADLAAACGYADQAHFNRDFAEFAGESPLQLCARMLPDGTGILAAAR